MRSILIPLALLLALVVASPAAITVTGLVARSTYSGTVEFTIPSESGFAITATLNGEAIPLDLPYLENRPGYYELVLTKTPDGGGETEELTIPFIVSDPARSSADRGVPTWTPRPAVDAPDSVLDNTTVTFVTPSAVAPGEAFPLLVRLENAAGKIARVNATPLVRDASGKAIAFKLLRGAGAGSWIAPAAGSFTLTLRLGTRTFEREIAIISSAEQSLGGDLTASQTFAPGSFVAITGDTTLPAGMTLRFEEGCFVRIAPGATIQILGALEIAGTPNNPVVFLPANSAMPWGGFFLRGGTASADLDGAFFTGGGAQANWTSANGFSAHRTEQPILTFDAGTSGGTCVANLTDIWIVDNPTAQGAHSRNATVTFERCVVQRTQSVGQFNGGTMHFVDSHALEFPVDSSDYVDADNDGLYLRVGDHEVRGSVIGWAKDDAIDCGSSTAGTLLVEDSWLDSNFHEGFALSGDKIVTIDNTVAINNGQGLEVGYSGGLNRPVTTATNMLIVGNAYGARFGDNYNVRYNGSLDLSSSFVLQNQEDIFGVEFTSWTYREDKLTIENNVLTTGNLRHPVNSPLDPATHSSQIGSRLAPGARGFGLVERSPQNPRAQYGGEVSLYLDRPAADPLSVPWEIFADNVMVANGSLEFPPGEVYAALALPALPAPHDSANWIAVRFESSGSAIATGHSSCHFIDLPTPGAIPGHQEKIGQTKFLFWEPGEATAETSDNLEFWLERPDLTSPIDYSRLPTSGRNGFIRLKSQE